MKAALKFWRRLDTTGLDTTGLDTCHLEENDTGWTLDGTVVFCQNVTAACN